MTYFLNLYFSMGFNEIIISNHNKVRRDQRTTHLPISVSFLFFPWSFISKIIPFLYLISVYESAFPNIHPYKFKICPHFHWSYILDNKIAPNFMLSSTSKPFHKSFLTSFPHYFNLRTLRLSMSLWKLLILTTYESSFTKTT
jgi:hypothetical protein